MLKAIREGKPISKEAVTRVLGRYTDNLLLLRGETLARTEALKSLHASQDEA